MPTSPPRAPFSPRVVRSTAVFGVVLALAVAATFLPLPAGFLGLPFGVASLVFGIRALVIMRSGSSPALRVVTILGLVVAGSVSVIYAELAVFHNEAIAYERCSWDAITRAAAVRCEEDFRQAVAERIARWTEGSGSDSDSSD